jgi:hypothetical protein
MKSLTPQSHQHGSHMTPASSSSRLVAAAEAIVDTLTAHAGEAEQLRQLAGPSVQAMTAAEMYGRTRLGLEPGTPLV